MRRTRFIVSLIAVCFSAVLFFLGWSTAPLLHEVKPLPSTRVLARDGSLLYQLAEPDQGFRANVTFEQIPPVFIQALLAAEDARFYQHHGIDWRALVRVLRDSIVHGHSTSGASTLEQQLIKNLYFPGQSRTVLQKVRELVAARFWSATHTKEQTLEAYVNTIYFGRASYGIGTASQRFFRKSVTDLDTAESAMLAGFIHAPSVYDPLEHPEQAYARAQWVLDRMQTLGFLSSDAWRTAREEKLAFFTPRQAIEAPHFVFHVLEEAKARYPDLVYGGYVIHTTLDPAFQQAAEASVVRRLIRLKDQHVNNAAALAMDPKTGDVLAYVGNTDYFEAPEGKIDMVQASRQPGSALKPFLYFTAFLHGLTPASIIADTPVRFETGEGRAYYPRNYGYRYHGPVMMRDALGSSLNIPAVRVLDQVGLPTFVSMLARFGIVFPESPDHYGLSIVLGGGEVTLWDMVGAYGRLAQFDAPVLPRTILEIDSTSGHILFQASSRLLASPSFRDIQRAPLAAALVTDILSDPLARLSSFGEASLMNMGRGVAIKTGTTKDFKDNWAVGYADDLVVGVWVGNATGEPMQGVSGVSGAVPIWHDLMQFKQESHWTERRKLPPGLLQKDICSTSGLLANGICPRTRQEIFMVDTEPQKPDDWYVRCGSSGIYLHPPAEYSGWLFSSGQMISSDPTCPKNEASSVQILSPLDGDAFEIDRHTNQENQRISWIAGGGSGPYHWRLNGTLVESNAPLYLWDPMPGVYTLELEGAGRQIHFSVRE